jgi:hypothetical protein
MPPIDPSFLKIWHAWVSWWSQIPYWDPYGAAFTLLFVGFASGYVVFRFVNEK